jgi:hypothetical protein
MPTVLNPLVIQEPGPDCISVFLKFQAPPWENCLRIAGIREHMGIREHIWIPLLWPIDLRAFDRCNKPSQIGARSEDQSAAL